ncbi:hypothetical protein HGI30_02270 [Paenibacillus albicereus]|uniref:Uncharacterized protein n=1 Tax=Paenibacillus albicereus TaxID=2726185 RepID=A0A6H2GT10_9BACL|nr:hypothetical protein [Paenibacillus albicereus]QJC50532.1 hypothetical protein HGI30_02270 [Paenibacillus albicereus]
MNLEREVQDLKQRVEVLEARERERARESVEQRHVPTALKERGFGKPFLTGFVVMATVLFFVLISVGVIQFISQG